MYLDDPTLETAGVEDYFTSGQLAGVRPLVARSVELDVDPAARRLHRCQQPLRPDGGTWQGSPVRRLRHDARCERSFDDSVAAGSFGLVQGEVGLGDDVGVVGHGADAFGDAHDAVTLTIDPGSVTAAMATLSRSPTMVASARSVSRSRTPISSPP